ncbi:hypothetical protein [Kitasatospora purpeofusca]|uniref:hypothetical protein n=1 Tax=Kitasatospora purpeofusca TaxID=67352 RepID=UPI003661D9B4
MAWMNVGELVATFDVDASGARRGIAEGRAELAGLQRDANGQLRDLRGRFASESLLMGQALASGIEAGSRAAADAATDAGHRVADGLGQGGEDGSRRLLSSLSDAELAVHGFTRTADGRIRDLRGRWVAESATIGEALTRIGADGDQAGQRVSRSLGSVSRDLRRGGDDGRGMGRALASIGDAAGAIGGIAGRLSMVAGTIGAIIPVAAGLSAALVAVAPAAGIAATALLAVASAGAAIKIGSSGVGAAIKAAFADAPAAAGAASGAAGKVASAQRAVQDATEQAARANERSARQVEDAQRTVGDAVQAASDAQIEALRQVAQAERSLEDAQRSALQAQRDLDDARTQAAQDLEDLQDRLIDGALDQRSATLRVQQAQESLNKVLADPTATQLQRDQAQLAVDEALQHQREQGTAYDRLKAQAAAAAQAGVEGAERVVSAQERLADAQRAVGDEQQALADAHVAASKRVAAADRDVSDARRALGDAQREQAQTAADGAQQVARAMEALQQGAAGAAGGGVDPLAAALAKLSPNARAFAEEVIRLKPALADLKFDVQQALFAGLDTAFRASATSTLPVLHGALVTSAGHLGAMAKEAMATAGHLAENGTLGQALGSANRGLGSMSRLPATIVQGLVQIGAAAGPEFEKLSAAAGNGLDKLAARMDAALASGGMQRAIEQAVQVLGELFTVVGNVGKIVGEVFGAAQQQGGSFVQTLVKITAELAKAFASPAVQAGLAALFQTMGQLATTAAPLLGQALQVVAPVLTALAPGVQALVQALGTGLQPVVVALGPVLAAAARAVSELLKAISPILPVIGTLIGALLPVLTPLLDGVATIARQLAPLIGALAKAFGDALSPVIAVLPQLITPFVTILTTLVEALLPPLTELITQLPLAELGQSFAAIAVALTPVLTQLAVLLGQQLQVMMPILTPIIAGIGQLAQILSGVLASYIQNIVVPALNTLAALLQGDFSGAWSSAKELVRGFVTFTIDLFVNLPARLGELLVRVGTAIWDGAGQAWSKLKEAAVQKIESDFLPWARNLDRQILDAIGDLGQTLKDAGRRVISGFMDGIRSGLGPLTNLLSGITSMIPMVKGPPERDARLLTPAGRSIMDGLLVGVDSRIPALRAQLRGVTAEISDQFANIGGGTLPWGGGPQMAMAGAAGGFGGGLQITNYYESESGSARSTAEELAWMAKGRG